MTCFQLLQNFQLKAHISLSFTILFRLVEEQKETMQFLKTTVCRALRKREGGYEWMGEAATGLNRRKKTKLLRGKETIL